MWETMGTKAGETRVAKAKGGRDKRRIRKEARRKGKEEEEKTEKTEERKNDRSKEGS